MYRCCANGSTRFTKRCKRNHIDGYLFHSQVNREDPKLVTDFIRSTSGLEIKPVLQRLRATWLVMQLQARVPLATLLDEAGRASKHLWGWEAEYIVQSSNDPTVPADFPLIVLGIAFHKPGVASAVEALGAFRSIRERGHEPGYVMGDRLNFPGTKEMGLQLPLRQLGYEPVHDYRVDQLGIKAHYAGAKLVEGTWYCPSMPEALVTATTDYRDTGPKKNVEGKLYCSKLDEPIDEETWRARVDRRSKYALRRKEKPDADGCYPMMCPASGPSATVTCPLKPQHTGTKVAVTISIGKPPAEPPRICTNKSSVTFPPEAVAKYR